MSQRWLIVGGNGQLGHEFTKLLGDAAVGLDLPEIDITDSSSCQAAITNVAPTVAVNCAAYTAVDKAEEQEDIAYRINADGAGNLARACAAASVPLVQLSTDYVFSGNQPDPYAEDAAPDPQSAYGRTKLAGEYQVLESSEDHYVVRTAWLYGAYGQNFVRTMLRLAKQNETLSVVADQHGQPTWAADLARQIVALVGSAAPGGIYHGTSAGATTWYGFTRKIFGLAGLDPDRVEATTTANFPRPATRPPNSVLGHDRWQLNGLATIQPWEEAIASALPHIQAHELP